MPSPSRTYKPLNSKQYEILGILYLYRYATTALMADALNLKSKIKMNERLAVLLEQEYIGRRYGPEYRLQRKHASYYLLTKGVNALKQKEGNEYEKIDLPLTVSLIVA
jgi:transcriptional antiterminator Rof (Rho-off)